MNKGKFAYKNKWDNPYTGRVWHECGGCKGKVSAMATECKHCKATFKNYGEASEYEIENG